MGEITDELLAQVRAGKREAIEAIAARSLRRLEAIARRSVRTFPHLPADTDDIVQGASLRLHRALLANTPPDSRQLFFLASALIRRELIDLKRKHYGPRGIGRNHASSPRGQSDSHDPLGVAADSTFDPHKLARWTELHERVAAMPEPLRAVFDLLWYQELTHAQAAEILGISTKSVQRRWRDARLQLHHLVDDDSV
jgi:RNA polymerase sigma factor (sigma-70 family)